MKCFEYKILCLNYFGAEQIRRANGLRVLRHSIARVTQFHIKPNHDFEANLRPTALEIAGSVPGFRYLPVRASCV